MADEVVQAFKWEIVRVRSLVQHGPFRSHWSTWVHRACNKGIDRLRNEWIIRQRNGFSKRWFGAT